MNSQGGCEQRVEFFCEIENKIGGGGGPVGGCDYSPGEGLDGCV